MILTHLCAHRSQSASQPRVLPSQQQLAHATVAIDNGVSFGHTKHLERPPQSCYTYSYLIKYYHRRLDISPKNAPASTNYFAGTLHVSGLEDEHIYLAVFRLPHLHTPYGTALAKKNNQQPAQWRLQGYLPHLSAHKRYHTAVLLPRHSKTVRCSSQRMLLTTAFVLALKMPDPWYSFASGREKARKKGSYDDSPLSFPLWSVWRSAAKHHKQRAVIVCMPSLIPIHCPRIPGIDPNRNRKDIHTTLNSLKTLGST